MRKMRKYYPRILEDIWSGYKSKGAISELEQDFKQLKKAIVEHRYGQAGLVKIDRTSGKTAVYGIHMAWYTHKDKKEIKWTYNPKQYPACVYITMQWDAGGDTIYKTYDKIAALADIYPEKKRAAVDLMLRREMAEKGVRPPAAIKVNAVMDSGYGLYTIGDQKNSMHLCSPEGCVKLPEWAVSVYDACLMVGIDVRSLTPDAPWENTKPFWDAANLEKED